MIPREHKSLTDEFDEYELKSMTVEEKAALELADTAWLARERAEQNELILSLEEALAALLETMRPGEPLQQAEAAQPDPPGWPDL